MTRRRDRDRNPPPTDPSPESAAEGVDWDHLDWARPEDRSRSDRKMRRLPTPWVIVDGEE